MREYFILPYDEFDNFNMSRRMWGIYVASTQIYTIPARIAEYTNKKDAVAALKLLGKSKRVVV